MERKETVLVTISRQFGSGGAYIGQSIAKRLGYEYVDRGILQQAARRLGEEESRLSAREERVTGFWEGFFRAFSTGIPEAGYVPPPIRPVYDKDLFDAEAESINEIADIRDAVIIGRGGFHVLKGRPGLVKVFIHANREFRVRRAMEVYGIKDIKEAASLLDDLDRERRRFIHTMTGVDWTDARNYDLCIDTGVVDFPAAEEMVLKLVECRKKRLGL